jgi:hypothetical protein
VRMGSEPAGDSFENLPWRSAHEREFTPEAWKPKPAK